MANMIDRAGADALIPTDVATEIISGVRTSSAAMNVFRRLPNMSTRVSKMPVLEMLPHADFVDGDAGMKITTSVAWAKKQLVVGEIAAIVPIPEAVLDDSDYDIWAEVRPLLVESFGRVFDRQVFQGGNPKAPTEWPQALISQAVAAGNIVTIGTGKDILDDINSAMEELEEYEYDINGLVGQSRLRGKLRNLRDANNNLMFGNAASGSDNNPFGVPLHYVGKGVWDRNLAMAILGEWENAVYSIRQDMTFKVFTEGVVNDDEGKVVYNLMTQDMVALRAVMRLAWQVANPIHIDRTGSDRKLDPNAFPFAILRPGPVTP